MSISFTDVRQAIEQRPIKIMVEGDPGSGKTTFSLSVLNYLKTKGYKSDEIMYFFIDMDGQGAIPLLARGAVPDEYVDAIKYVNIGRDEESTIFENVSEALRFALNACKKHITNHPRETAWIILDNMGAFWTGTMDFFSKQVYERSLEEQTLEKRKEAEKTPVNPTTGHKIHQLPTFIQLSDFTVINQYHDSVLWMLRDSGVNYILTALLKSVTITENTSEGKSVKVTVIKNDGKKTLPVDVNEVIRMSVNNNNRLASFTKAREMPLLQNIADMDFSKYMSIIAKYSIIKPKAVEKKPAQIKKEVMITEGKIETDSLAGL